MGDENLRRCPFCGCAAIMVRESNGWWRARCVNPGVEPGYVCGMETLLCPGSKEARRMWNRRPATTVCEEGK